MYAAVSVFQSHRREYWFSVSAALYALIGGVTSLLGWALGVPRLYDWTGTGISIKPNATVCLSVAGLGLLAALGNEKLRPITRLAGGFVLVVAILTLIQHAFGLDLGIDTLLFAEPAGARATTSPGRMGIPGSSALTLVGLGLICSTWSRSRRLAATLGLIASGISALSLIGYLYGADELYDLPRLTAIAFQTAAMIAALGLGIVAAIPEASISEVWGRKDAGGMLFRRLAVPLIVCSLGLGWLRLFGQNAGLYDTSFGTAARTFVEIVMLLGLLWWTANSISRSDAVVKVAETALADNEERLRLATEIGKVGVWDWDIRQAEISWTDSMYGMFGIKPGQFDGRPESFFDLVHSEDRRRIRQRMEGAQHAKLSFEDEFRVERPNGEFGWIFTTARVLDDGVGTLRMLGAAVDITERKKAEEQFAALAAIVDSSHDAIIGIDLAGTITSWNAGAEKLFGYRSAEMIACSVTLLLPPDSSNEEISILEKIRRGDLIEHYETKRRHKDGHLIDISLSVSPVTDSAGRIVGASKIARDITQHRQTEAALRDREIMRRLVDAQEAERHRIARDLHDHLGQHLTGLRLKLESIRGKCNGDQPLVHDVDEAQSAAARIDLDINYLAWELRPTELEQLGLSDALKSFVHEWSKTYGIAGEFHGKKFAKGDLTAEVETNLYRIVQEALHNILKHARATSVNVLLDRRGNAIVLIIEDNGVGFERESGPTTGSPHRGHGLIGMRERTALLGGTLEIESKRSKGTTIFARVPIPTDADKGKVFEGSTI